MERQSLTFRSEYCFFQIIQHESNRWKKGQTKMSIDSSGLAAKVQAESVLICVPQNSLLLALANLIDWQLLAEIISSDLKKTPSGKWWLGRKITLRIHLGCLILQSLFNETDRGIEQRLHGDALWQLFCGKNIIEHWHVPDHTRIEEFRNRLSPATHHEIALLVMKFAKDAGFAKSEWMDIDSTTQEANISYPSDASLMLKLARKARKLVELGIDNMGSIKVNVEKVAALAKEYFFAGKSSVIEYKRELFRVLHQETVKQVVPVIEQCSRLFEEDVQSLGSRAQALIAQVSETGLHLLASIESFIKTGVFDRTKPLSLHTKAIACVTKGKLGKPFEFGRVFQLGRISGNFLFIAKAQTLLESDKSAVGRMIHLHRKIFGSGALKELGGDRGYHSSRNVRAAKMMAVEKIAIQKPTAFRDLCPALGEDERRRLSNRRSGIEPLIGHVKHGGLRKSRMKTDQTTEASAYRCVTGFNLRQLLGHIGAKAAS